MAGRRSRIIQAGFRSARRPLTGARPQFRRIVPIPAALAVAAAFLLAGCSFLFPPPDISYLTPAPSDEPLAPPTLGPAFHAGEATITFAGAAPIQLRLVQGGGLDGVTSVTWSDGTGWYLQYEGSNAVVPIPSGAISPIPSDLAMPVNPAMIMLDRIAGPRHLTADTDACTTKVTRDDATGVAGTATCKGLTWADAMVMPMGTPVPVPGISAATATITFSATP